MFCFILINNNKIKNQTMKKLSITLLFLVQLHAAIAQNKTEDVTLTDIKKLNCWKHHGI
jgi:hypothetical protein